MADHLNKEAEEANSILRQKKNGPGLLMMKIRKLLLKLILTIGVFFCIVLIGYMSLNYVGFCFKERRFLSDEEKIAIGVRDVLAAYPPVIDLYEERNGEVVEVGRSQPDRPIHYKDVDSFFAENPDCCKVTRIMERSGYTVRLEHRLLGSANTFVEVKYKVKYMDAHGVGRSSLETDYIAISNCGYPWSGM